MGIVAVSSLRTLSDIKCRVVRLSEDLWLTKKGDVVSYIDLLVHVEKDTRENLPSMLIFMDSKVRKVSDVSSLWYENPKKYSEGIGGYMYSNGMEKRSEDENNVYMSIDGIDCLVPKRPVVQTMPKKSPNIFKIDFPEPVKPNETIGMKIEVLQSGVYRKSDVYPSEGYRMFEIFPYCHWAVGVDRLNEFGFKPENLMPVEAYYLYLFLPPKFETNRALTTRFMTLDLAKCDTCTRFCPFPERVSNLTGEPLALVKKDREGIRWKIENLKDWIGRSIEVLFSPSSPTVKPFKIRLVESLLSLLLVGFCVNVIAGLVYNYDLLKLVASIALLGVAIIPLIYILWKYPA